MQTRADEVPLRTNSYYIASLYVKTHSSFRASISRLNLSKHVFVLSSCTHIVFSVVDVLRPGALLWPLAVVKPFGCSSCCQLALKGSFAVGPPSPYIIYCTPRNESHAAWNMPQILNAGGIDVEEVKNQNIFMLSPISQLASTETLNPLQDRDRIFDRICGIGSVASTERPMIPISEEYDWYTQGTGASSSSKTTRPANRPNRHCQYLFPTSAPPCLQYLVVRGQPTALVTSTARS